MTPGRRYLIKLATRSVSGSVSMIHHRIYVNTLEHHDANELKLNEIGFCNVALNAPVVFDPYNRNLTTGSFIVIDRLTNVTVGAGMIIGDASTEEWSQVTAEERATRFGQTASVIVLSGNNAKQTAYHLERKLFDTGHAVTVLEQASATVPALPNAPTLGDLPPSIHHLVGASLQSNELARLIKNAGLLCLCLNFKPAAADLTLDCDEYSVDDLYAALKNHDLIH
jgi:hypothetical protein